MESIGAMESISVLGSLNTFKVIESSDAGEKVIIEGVEFSDGRVVVRWTNNPSSIVIWNSLSEFKRISTSQPNRRFMPQFVLHHPAGMKF